MKIKNKKLIKNLILSAAAFFAAVSLGIVIYYIAFPSAAVLHADCTDTILWANASVESKSLFNSDFGYAAMLPFGGTTVMIPFVAIFGYSLAAHQAGMIAFTLLFALAAFLLCRCLEFDYTFSFFSVGSLLLIIASSAKMREIFYEHTIYYSICAAVIFVLLSMILKLKNKKNTTAALIVAVIFSMLSAIDGMQVIATGIFPVLFGAGAYILLEKKKIFDEENRNVIFGILCICAGTFFGFVALKKFTAGISAGYAEAYSTYSGMNDWVDNFLKLPKHWFELFGVEVENGLAMFSFASIINLIRIAAALIVAFAPAAALITYKKLGNGAKMLTLAHFGLAGVILFGYIFGILSAANWRLSPLICTGILVTCALMFNFGKELVPKRIAAGICVLFVAMSAVSAVIIAKMPKNGEELNGRYGITHFLMDQGLHTGYATFWNSQVITLLSDCDVRVANIDVNENGIAPCGYQTDKKWFENREGEKYYFVLLSPDELETLSGTADYEKFRSLVKGAVPTEYGYTVYLFDSTQVLY